MDTGSHTRRRLSSFCLSPSTDKDPRQRLPSQMPPNASAGAVGGLAASSSSSSEKDRRTITVLIVEDSDALRQSTADILSPLGYHVIEAADGIEGLHKLRNEPVDILILDFALPRLDGPGVLDALEDWPVVIVVSAFEYYNERAMRERFGPKVFAYLRKPVPPQLLLDVVADAASGPSPSAT